jgi:quercetin dioxygenase-like cupin family protein
MGTAAIVTVAPGGETGWHEHQAPLFAWMLDGTLTVDYGPDGTKVYDKGAALLEAFRSRHNGQNLGTRSPEKTGLRHRPAKVRRRES